VHLELKISTRILRKKNQNACYGILRGLGETDSCKKFEVKNLVALSFKCSLKHCFTVSPAPQRPLCSGH
jgi:hypothetical protein